MESLTIGGISLIALLAIITWAIQFVRERERRKLSPLDLPNLFIARIEYMDAWTGASSHPRIVEVEIRNSGNHIATIKKGHVLLDPSKYPEAYKPEPLAGVKVEKGHPHIVKIATKHGVMHPNGVGEWTIKLHCQMTYEIPNRPDGEIQETYTYDQQKRKFYQE